MFYFSEPLSDRCQCAPNISSFLKTICSDFAAPIAKVGRAAKTPLTAVTWLQRAVFAAKICDCCSQPFHSSFQALPKAILQRCSFRTGSQMLWRLNVKFN